MNRNQNQNTNRKSHRIRKYLSFVICHIIPPKAGLIIFSQPRDPYSGRDRYSGNARALFEWLLEAGYNVRWLYRNPPPKAPGIPKKIFVNRRSLKGTWIAIRANIAVIGHSLGDFGKSRFFVRHRKVVMLWHGISLKNQYLLDEKNKIKNALSMSRYYNLLTASSQIDRYFLAASEHVRVDKIAVTGLPRNDYLLKLADQKSKHEDSPYNQTLFLYAPTFRDYVYYADRFQEDFNEIEPIFFPFPDYDEKHLISELRNLGIRIILRPHPYDNASIEHCIALSESHADVFEFSDSKGAEYPAELIIRADAIISDYSSTYLDFVLLGKPCVFIPWDIDLYRQTRGLAYNYDMITPGPKVTTQADFLEAITAIKTGTHDEQWAAQYKMVRAMFHEYTDANNCARVASAIDKLMTSSTSTAREKNH